MKFREMKKYQLCVSLSGNDFSFCYHVAQHTELAELRLDMVSFSKVQLKKLFSLNTQFIVACRPGKIKDNNRAKLLIQAIDLGASFIDIEIDSKNDFRDKMLLYATKKKCKIILSYHNFTETPSEKMLREIIDRAKAFNPWKIKIVTKANTLQDNDIVLSLYKYTDNLIAFCMGEKGKFSRVHSILSGAAFTYVAADKNKKTAPGQIDIITMQQLISDTLRK